MLPSVWRLNDINHFVQYNIDKTMKRIAKKTVKKTVKKTAKCLTFIPRFIAGRVWGQSI